MFLGVINVDNVNFNPSTMRCVSSLWHCQVYFVGIEQHLFRCVWLGWRDASNFGRCNFINLCRLHCYDARQNRGESIAIVHNFDRRAEPARHKNRKIPHITMTKLVRKPIDHVFGHEMCGNQVGFGTRVGNFGVQHEKKMVCKMRKLVCEFWKLV